MVRRRLRGVVLVVVGLFGIQLLIGHFLLAEPVEEAAVAELECRRFVQPTTVEGINEFITTARATRAFAGGDVGASTALADGRTFWVFGDTLRPRGAPMVRNSVLVVGNGCAGALVPADGGAAVPDREDGVGYWPMTVDSAPDGLGGTRVVVGLMRVRTTGGGVWDFEIAGSSAARFHVPENGVPELVGVVDVGPDRIDSSAPLWGAAATLMDDGTVYLYGTATTGEPLVFGYSLYVARTTVEELTQPNTWQYWDGVEWNAEPSSAAELIPAQDGVSRALTVFERDGTWYAVSKRHDFLGHDLVIWSAPAPTGPFVAGAPVAQIPSDDEWMAYLALAHPDVLTEDGSVVVSWSVNSMDPDVVEQNPIAYRPRFLRVPLPG